MCGWCRAASRLLVQISGLLYSFETGTLRLDLCKRHRTLLEAVRQDTATALTALSGLIFASVSGGLVLPLLPECPSASPLLCIVLQQPDVDCKAARLMMSADGMLALARDLMPLLCCTFMCLWPCLTHCMPPCICVMAHLIEPVLQCSGIY